MGKKMKTKARNPRKVHPRASSGSASCTSDLKEGVGDEDVRDGEQCSHYSQDSAEVNRILSAILSSKDAACEHCREESVPKRSGGKKGKQQKKREGGEKNSDARSESHFVWVCLDCSRYFCGGAVSDSVPYGHSRRHSKQERHACAVRLDNPIIGWCFSCNMAIPVELPPVTADAGEGKSTAGDKRVGGDGIVPSTSEGGKGYMIRGLPNLGNTCFFNSVMQNLLSIDMLRQCMVNLDRPIGQLTMALKKLFDETRRGTDSKGVLSPKSLFGCICSKAPQFRGYQQQDSHELLRCLLDGLYVEERSAGKSQDSSNDQAAPNSGNTMVDNIFGGELSSTVCCVECGHTSIVHEPFLDLSLPLPSKKIPSKKAPPPPPKRSKPPLKERNKSRRFREKGSARGSVVMEQSGPDERVTSSVECSESSGPISKPEENSHCVITAPKTEQNIAPEAEHFSWMDYLAEPTMTPDALESGSQTCENFVVHCSDSGQILQSENNIMVESEVDNFPKELMVSSDSCGENSSRNDISSSCTHDSRVILLPYEELDPNTNAITGVTSPQNPDNMSSSDNPRKEISVQAAAVSDSEQTEVDFDGFGDLFNEPEVTSELKTDTGLAEEMAETLWANNNYETNQEVDDSNAPVSIASCLALFTNIELLSDEHAWYCENCAEVLSSDMTTDKTGKSEALVTLGQSDIMKLQDDGDQGTSEKVLFNLQVDCQNSTDLQELGNRETAFSFADTESHSVWSDSDQKSLNIVGESGEIRYKIGEVTTGSNTMLPGSIDQIGKQNVMLGDQEFVDSGSGQIKGNDTISGKEDIQTSGQALAATLASSPDNTGASLSNSSRNDSLDINHERKKGSKLSSQVQPVKGRRVKQEEPGKRKVKRDATKRILISKTPPVLTIHLKRFSQDARGRLSKLRDHVLFQEMLDLRPYLDPRCEEKEKCTYRLLGVVEHSGGMTGGHYVAYVRGERDGGKAWKDVNSPSWFYASDVHVREASFSEVLKCEAYILFFEKM